MDRSFIVKDTMSALKCALCSSYLSVPPIMVISEDGSQYKCGRCKQIDCTTYGRNFGYEKLAELMTFPCTFKDCEERIGWGQVEAHETLCVHRTITCPIHYENCCDTVKVNELKDHFSTKHKENLLTDVFNISLKSLYYIIGLLIADNEQYFIVCQYGIDFVSASVQSIVPKERRELYTLKLTSANSSSEILCKDHKVLYYDERKHCRRCLYGQCQKKYHSASLVDSADKYYTTQIKTTAVKELLKQPDVINFSIEIVKRKQPVKEVQGVLKGSEKCAQTRVMICKQRLECPICMKYMMPPIYTCKIGHTICKSCKPKLKACPCCNTMIGKSRNYALEEIVEEVEVPCIHEEGGCDFVGKISQAIEHEENCCFENDLFNLTELFKSAV